jgi:hypothetical protein
MPKIVQKVLAPNAVYSSSVVGNNAQKGYAGNKCTKRSELFAKRALDRVVSGRECIAKLVSRGQFSHPAMRVYELLIVSVMSRWVAVLRSRRRLPRAGRGKRSTLPSS